MKILLPQMIRASTDRLNLVALTRGSACVRPLGDKSRITGSEFCFLRARKA